MCSCWTTCTSTQWRLWMEAGFVWCLWHGAGCLVIVTKDKAQVQWLELLRCEKHVHFPHRKWPFSVPMPPGALRGTVAAHAGRKASRPWQVVWFVHCVFVLGMQLIAKKCRCGGYFSHGEIMNSKLLELFIKQNHFLPRANNKQLDENSVVRRNHSKFFCFFSAV